MLQTRNSIFDSDNDFFSSSFFFFFFPLPTVDVERKKREKRWETSRWDEVGRVVKRLLLAVSLRAGRRPVCLGSQVENERREKEKKKGGKRSKEI